LLSSTSELEEHEYNVYPNPSKETIFVRAKEHEVKDISLSLFDLSGRHIKTVNNTSQIELSNLNQGLYFLTVYNEGRLVHTERVVVTR
jgi:hypothetical protein